MLPDGVATSKRSIKTIQGLSPYVRLDQHFAGGGFDCNADAEERAERGGAGATAIETENEFVEIGLKVFLVQTVVDAERPGLPVGEDAVDPRRTTWAAIGPMTWGSWATSGAPG